MNRLALSAFAIAALSCAFAGGVRAFTYDGRASLDTNVSLRYQEQDPDSKFRSNLSNGNGPGQNGTSGKFGNFSFKFSGANGTNGFGGSPDRFVPSGNSAFGSPFGPNNLDLALGNRH